MKTAVKQILSDTELQATLAEVATEVENKLKEVADIIGIGLPLVKYRIGKAKELLSVYLGDKK